MASTASTNAIITTAIRIRRWVNRTMTAAATAIVQKIMIMGVVVIDVVMIAIVRERPRRHAGAERDHVFPIGERVMDHDHVHRDCRAQCECDAEGGQFARTPACEIAREDAADSGSSRHLGPLACGFSPRAVPARSRDSSGGAGGGTRSPTGAARAR